MSGPVRPLTTDVRRLAEGYPRRVERFALYVLRYVLPAVLCLVGMIVLVARGADSTAIEVAAMFIGAGLSVLMLNVIFRVGALGDRDRDEEDAARRFFDEHGHWPDELGDD